jgi:hypothetical protein
MQDHAPVTLGLPAGGPVAAGRRHALVRGGGHRAPTGTPVTLTWEKLRSHEDVLPAKEQLASLLA